MRLRSSPVEPPCRLEHSTEPGGYGLVKDFAFFRERDRAMASAEQAHSERRFELPNRPADRRLGDVQLKSRDREGLDSSRGLENHQVICRTDQMAKLLHVLLPTDQAVVIPAPTSERDGIPLLRLRQTRSSEGNRLERSSLSVCRLSLGRFTPNPRSSILPR